MLVADLTGVPPFDHLGAGSRVLLLGVFDGHAGAPPLCRPSRSSVGLVTPARSSPPPNLPNPTEPNRIQPNLLSAPRSGHEAADHLASQFTSALLSSPLLNLGQEATSTRHEPVPQSSPEDGVIRICSSPRREEGCGGRSIAQDSDGPGLLHPASFNHGCGRRDYCGALREALLR